MKHLFHGKSLTFLTIAAFLVGGFFVFTANVKASEPVTTAPALQAAISSAISGDIILVGGTLGSAIEPNVYEVIADNVTIKGLPGNTIYGTFNLKGAGDTLDSLNIYSRDGVGDSFKNAVNVISNSVNITNCKFEMSNPIAVGTRGEVGNGVVIWPYGTSTPNLNISGNTFTKYSAKTVDSSSTGLLIAENITLARFGIIDASSISITISDEQALVTGNTFDGNNYDYIRSDWHNFIGDNIGENLYSKVSNAEGLSDVIENSFSGAIILISGTLGGNTDDFTLYEVTQDNITIKGLNGNKIYGTFNLKGDGDTLDSLNIYSRGGGNDSLKNAVNVISKSVNITNCNFEMSNPDVVAANGGVGNGVVIWPYGTATSSLNIVGNTFVGYGATVPDWSSTGLLIAQNFSDLTRFGMAGHGTSISIANEQALANGNTYTNNNSDYVNSDWGIGGVSLYSRISNTTGLKDAIENSVSGATILIGANLNTTEKILINKPLIIKGGNNSIVFTNDLNGWQGNYVIQVYGTIGVTLSDIKLTGGDAALLINGSTVTLTGKIDVSGNEFGGIEVSKGSAVGLSNASLTVTGVNFINTTEAYKLPTIWLVNGQGEIFDAPASTNSTIKIDQTQYYINAINSAPVVIVPATPNYGGGGGGYTPASICSSVTYGEWGNAVNGIQYRNLLVLTPSSCTLTATQESARSRIFTNEVVEPVITPVTTATSTPDQQVLGEKKFADGTLVRGTDNRIYLVINNTLTHITSLQELAKHAGKVILKTEDGVIASFAKTSVLGVKKYANGTLIKTKGDVKIYVVKDGKKMHIKSLVDLKNYKGKVLNIASSELSLY